jgi:hypothetical protein
MKVFSSKKGCLQLQSESNPHRHTTHCPLMSCGKLTKFQSSHLRGPVYTLARASAELNITSKSPLPLSIGFCCNLHSKQPAILVSLEIKSLSEYIRSSSRTPYF